MREKRTAKHMHARDMVYDHIMSKILDASLPFGTRLTEQAISDELGVSRTPVHDALAKLVNKGIAEYTPGVGIFLKEISRSDIQELIELRRVYEMYAVGVAAEKCAPYLLAKMKESCDMMYRLADEIRSGNAPEPAKQQLVKNNAEIMFHLSIIQATGNNHLIRIFSDTMLLTKTLCAKERNDRNIPLETIANAFWIHSKICRLIERKSKARAVSVMEQHINNALKTTLVNYDEEDQGGGQGIVYMDLYKNMV